MRPVLTFFASKFKEIILPVGVIIIAVLAAGWGTAKLGIVIPGFLFLTAFGILFLILVFKRPRIAFYSVIIFCFTHQILIREIGGFPYGIGVDLLLAVTCLAVAFGGSKENNWKNIKSDICILTFIWFAYNLLEFVNPAGASIAGAIQEMRTSALYWLLTVPACMVFFNRKKDLNAFLFLVLAFSLIAAVNGIKQLSFGLSNGEQQFLNAGAAKTHIIFGKLRVFSFYSDAGQFGASMAHIGLIALILALGPFKAWKRILLAIAAIILFYGMLISGTRGALFALIVGIAVALLLSKNIKVLIIGSAIALAGLFVLKYTFIGQSNYNIKRLRSSVNPNDASFNVRLYNQQILRDYLSDRPFGGGVGSIGFWGRQYNSGKFLSSIPPDSYWVKVWAEYGIVGFILWFGIMMYILGKCCGIVWNIRDKALRAKLIALTAGAAGVVFCSYGNEVINYLPTGIIVYISWCFVFVGPTLDSKPEKKII